MTFRSLPIFSACLVAGMAFTGLTAQARDMKLDTKDVMIPSGDAGIELFVRNKHPAGKESYSAEKILLFVHGATYPAETAFDLPSYQAQAYFAALTNAPYKRLVEIGEGTHTVMLEKNRMQFFREIIGFLDEENPLALR